MLWGVVGRNGALWGISRGLAMTTVSKPLFVGSFRHNLDVKNRLTIPAKWRFAGDENDVYLALPNPDGCIAVLPPIEVEKLYEKASQHALSDDAAQSLLNALFARAHSFGCDKQGRVGVTEDLLKHADIEKEAVLVGSLTKFSIWSPSRWEKVGLRTAGDNFGDLMRRFGI